VTMASAQVRDKLTEALALDLIGPEPGSALDFETIDRAPSKWYLTGWLVPVEYKKEPKAKAREPDSGPTLFTEDDEDLGQTAEEPGKSDEGNAPDGTAAKKAIFPSSMGLSFLVPKDANELVVTV